MKKRILSLFLAVVMLFSALSLNVFATDATTGAAEATEVAGTVVSDTLDGHTTAEMLAVLNNYKLADTPYTRRDGTSGISAQGSSTAGLGLVVENGKIVMKPGATAQARMDLSDHSHLNGRDLLTETTFGKTLPMKGASFVAQSSVEFTDQVKGKSFQIFQIADYMSKNRGNGYSSSGVSTPHVPTADSTMPVLLTVNGSMQLVASYSTTDYN